MKLAIRLVPRGLQERARPHVERFQAIVHPHLFEPAGYLEARDVVAVTLFSIPFGGFIMIPYHLQKLRRRLRSESDSRPTGGYR